MGEAKNKRKELLFSFKEEFENNSDVIIPVVYKDPSREIIPLRIALFSSKTKTILNKLSRFTDVDWIWFREPIIGAIDGLESFYYSEGVCPVSERVNSEILNLPCNIPDDTESSWLDGIKDVFNDGL